MPLTARLLWLLSVAIAAADALPLYYKADDNECQISIVESIPDNLTFNSTIQNLDTYTAYQALIEKATSEINFGSFYWTLRGTDVMSNPGNLSIKGETLLKNLIARSQSVPVKIAYNIGGFVYNMSDIELLSQQPNIKMVAVNISGLFDGGGVLHTKAVVADGIHAYMGSSNMDWRSLTQVKEFGLLLTNCPTLVSEINKTFAVYWLAGLQNRVPNPWPGSLAASTNATNPWKAQINGYSYSIYLGASPPPLCPPNWSRDIDAIINAISSAKKFIHIAVMEYEALITKRDQFWGVIDNALRAAAFRRVRIRLLVSHWQQSNIWMKRFIRSLTALNTSSTNIEGKYFIVPAFTPDQSKIPFSRVNHNKYMVTESTAVICTSNWAGDYFTATAGLAISIQQISQTKYSKRNPTLSIVEQVQAVFDRDWNSSYAHWNPFPTAGSRVVNDHHVMQNILQPAIELGPNIPGIL